MSVGPAARAVYGFTRRRRGRGFSVSGGKLYDQNGVAWRGFGIAVYGADAKFFNAALSTTLQTEFPGINVVRLATDVGDTAAILAPFVNAATAAGMAVILENHTGAQNVLTGTALTTESTWYASLATYYLANPLVLFGTYNEPGIGDADQMQATYAAIRGTGNNNTIFMESGQGAAGDPSTLGNTSVFPLMRNVAWDLHCYNWQTSKSTNVTTIQNDQNSRIAAMQTITSADGIMPVMCIETGEATDGLTRDAGGVQEIQATYTNTNLQGAVAWAWDNWGTAGLVNSLSNNGGNSLTTYGQQVAGYILTHP